MSRPVFNSETMSLERYQIELANFLRVELPRWAFAPSRYLTTLLERLADTEEQKRVLEFTPDVEWILGRPNFWCGPIAHRLIQLGLAKIDHKAEAEQAYVIHWLLGLYEKYGATFREEADKILKGTGT